MKLLYTLFLTAVIATWSYGQGEIPHAVVGTCMEPDSNTITVYFDYGQNCPEADPTGFLSGMDELGFHSGANDWEVIVAFDDPNAITVKNIGNNIFSATINTMEYYGKEVLDMEKVVFIFRSPDTNDPWDYGGRDDKGGGGFGGDEPCNNFDVFIADMPICSEQTQESSASLFGTTTIASSCVNSDDGTITLQFDNSLNCPEADMDGILAGTEALGFHSGANDWASTVAWDDDGSLNAVNLGNDIFSVTVNTMDYYGLPLDSMTNIKMVMNNGVASPDDAWTVTGKDERDGGFGGAEPCSDLIFLVSEAPACIVEPMVISSASLLFATGDAGTCKDPATGRVRIGFDLSLNCPEADSSGILVGAAELGFHSGANEWASTIAWDADGVINAKNNGSDVFNVTLDVMEYYGISYDSLTNIKMVMNNGISNPSAAWDVTGKDERDGGFGGDEPCSDLILHLEEAPTCDLSDPEEAVSSNALLLGSVTSCVDPDLGSIKIAFDNSLNCPEADTANMIAGVSALGFHSGANDWASTIAWDDSTAMNAMNNGSDVFEVIINTMDYYGLHIDSMNNIQMVMNYGVINPDDAWGITGKDDRNGGFGGDEPCSNLILDLSELPTCNLTPVNSSTAILTGLASSCVDANTGLIKVDFDLNQNCPEADSAGLLLGVNMLGFHSGINNWADQVAWDSDGALPAVNDGNDLFSVTFNAMDYYGKPLDSISEINFLFNNGFANPEAAWDNTGKDARDGSGFGGAEPCSNLLFELAEAPACDLSLTATSTSLIAGLATSCVDAEDGLIKLDFDLNQNCPEADSAGLLPGLDMLGFHSGINNWATSVAWDAEGAIPAVNDGNDLFSVTFNAMDYYGVPLDSITEINFLYNNGFANPDAAWDNTGKDARDGSGFGGDEPCSNLLFSLAEAEVCDLTVSNTVDFELTKSIKVSPNPFSNQVLVEFDNSNFEKYQINLMDLTGKIVYRANNVTESRIIIQRGNLPSGMYSLLLAAENGKFASTKLIIE